MDNFIGITIENYKIVSQLGKGGMGVVYKAYDQKLDRYVALKMLNAQNGDDDRFIERFKREARNQAKLTHPNIATVYDFIEYEGFLGIVMEYIDGESLEKIIFKRKRLSLIDSIYIIKQAIKGLGYAHSKGFVHRDIKPSNIIYTKEGVVKIMDFGISKPVHEKGMTKTGAKVGTLYYMSPEQVKGGDLTIQSDIYSVGCTLFEMLVGEPPFNSQTDFDVMEGHLKKDQPKISKLLIGMPEEVDRIITVAMKKNPEERFTSCEDLYKELTALETILDKLRPESFNPKEKSKKNVRLYSILGFSTFVVFTIMLSYFIYVQIHELLNSDTIEKLDRYNIQSLFVSDNKVDFKKIQKLQTNTTATINSVTFIDENRGFAIGDSGTFILTTDAGKSWQKRNIDSSMTFNDGYFLSNGKSFLVGNKSEIFVSYDFFNTFSKITFNEEFSLFRILFTSGNRGFALGSKGTLLNTVDGGKNWSKVSLPTNEILYDISFINNKIGFIVGWNGLVLRTDDGGLVWTKVDISSNKYFKSIAFFEDEIGVIVGGTSDIFRTDNAGDNWKVVKTGHIGSIHKVMFLSEKNILAVGTKGNLIFSENSGEKWKVIETGVFVNFTNVFLTPKGHIYISGINGLLLKII